MHQIKDQNMDKDRVKTDGGNVARTLAIFSVAAVVGFVVVVLTMIKYML
jgi:hypothetical protein